MKLDKVILMETTAFGSAWSGRVVDEKFPLLQWLGGSENCGSFLTVLGGMQDAVIQIMPASGVDADAYLAQWDFAMTLLHPHLSKILAAGRSVIDNRPVVYVVTESSGTSLLNIIQTEAVSADRARDIFNPVLSALLHLHKNGVVHGHISPSSIQFVGTKPKLSMTNFLITGSVKRSMAEDEPYDAPELQQEKGTAASDTWSVGMTMYEVMTQAPLSLSSTEQGRAQAVLPSPFREIVQDCLQFDPVRRCSIESVLERLNDGKASPPAERRIADEIQESVDAAPASQTAEDGLIAEDAVMHKAVQYPAIEETVEEQSTQPVLFSKSFERFEQAHLSRFRFMPYVAVLVAVMVLITVLFMRGHRSTSAAAKNDVSHSAASASERHSAAPTAPIPQHAEPAGSQPAAEDEARGLPPANTHRVPAADEPSPGAASSTANHVPGREETEGAVTRRVMPSVLPGAFGGRRKFVEVKMRVRVDKKGRVTDVAYVSRGPGNYFARAAQKAARSWEFDPPVRNGKPEPSAWILEFDFAGNKNAATATREKN